MKSTAINNLAAGDNSLAYRIEDGALEWLNGYVPSFSDSDIDAEVVRLQAEYDAQAYARDRASAYPSLTDQADMQYWDSVNGTTTWADAITAVKEAHPKP